MRIPTVPMYVKFAAALKILFRCFGEKGVWADTARYKDTCWTRDFGMAIQPLLLLLKEAQMANTHLTNLSAEQRPNGQIPILFLDDKERWLRMKAGEESAMKKESFMLRRHREGELWNLTPGTRDSEIIYIISMYEYAQATGDKSLLDANMHRITSALAHIESNLMQDGLVLGADWRDTMEKELGNKALLTNNCLLYHAYTLMGMTAKAEALKERINTVHFRKGVCIDYPGSDHFDPLGASFAVLYDVNYQAYAAPLSDSFRSVDTPYGVTIKCRHNPYTSEEVSVIDQTDGMVVWPFVVGFTVLALLKMRCYAFAEDQFNKLLNLNGFHEWYDPATGKGYGAKEQLWSATLYLRAMMTVMR